MNDVKLARRINTYDRKMNEVASAIRHFGTIGAGNELVVPDGLIDGAVIAISIVTNLPADGVEADLIRRVNKK